MSVNQGSAMAVNVSLWLSCLLVFFTLSFGFSTGSSDKGDDYLHYQLDNPFTSHSDNVYIETLSRHRHRRSPMEFDNEPEQPESYEKNRSSQKKVPPSPKSSNESQAPEEKDPLPPKDSVAPSTELGKTPAPPGNVNQTGKDENPVPYHLVPSEFTKKVEQSTPLPVNATTPAPVAHFDAVSEDSVEEDSMPEEITNSTLAKHNITRTEEDHHQYYNSSFIVDPDIGHSYWVNLKKKDGLRINDMLSKSYRRAATVKLSFDFPFYGSIVRNVTIATGGFLYTGEYVHSWLAATQYIAPLMANFDTRISNDSLIMYHDNGTAFTVQWEKVVLQDHPTEGEFTFQVTLHKNGDITFVYQNVPVIVEQIKDDHHPVKVGLSDAYIMDRTIFYVRRKTIYEYHRVDFRKEDIKNWTVIHLSALPTCLNLKDCISCLTEDIGFECNWCESAGRCSNGLDRHRQDWLMKGCPTSYVQSKDHCLSVPVGPSIELASSSAPPVTKDAPITKDNSWSSEVSHSQQSDLLDNYGQHRDLNGNIDAKDLDDKKLISTVTEEPSLWNSTQKNYLGENTTAKPLEGVADKFNTPDIAKVIPENCDYDELIQYCKVISERKEVEEIVSLKKQSSSEKLFVTSIIEDNMAVKEKESEISVTDSVILENSHSSNSFISSTEHDVPEVHKNNKASSLDAERAKEEQRIKSVLEGKFEFTSDLLMNLGKLMKNLPLHIQFRVYTKFLKILDDEIEDLKSSPIN